MIKRDRWKQLVVLVSMLALLMPFCLCSCDSTSVAMKSIYDLYVEQGFKGSVEDCLNSMDEKIIPIVRTAYVDDVNEGYDDTLIEWAANRKNAYLNEDGEIEISLASKESVKIGKAIDLIKKSDNASYDGIINISKVSATAGKDSVVEVSVKNNPGILGMELALSYDDKKLHLANVEEGNAFGKSLTFTKSKDLSSGCIFMWDGVELKKKDIKDGCILKLTFAVDKRTKPGNYSISLTPIKDSVFDNNLENLILKVNDGRIKVK